ncbi:MAG: 3-phosphoserine/phosphohydroxythreonine transaminase [SAR324 cluster bacterium]|nr:3-phosphoserine/phosphohydroxythreonine transaminase [SAR324 cluster bacterium]
MTSRVFNFGAGPAMLPIPVMKKVQEELLNFNGLGVSIVELSHRSKDFQNLVDETNALFRKLTNLPDNYKVLYMHGGAQMQFSAVPLNLIGRSPGKKALYVETGNFAKQAHKEAARYGDINVVASGAETNFDRIPELDAATLDKDAAYLHITSNNTIYGTCWRALPETGDLPLVIDATSDILSRVVDYSKVGIMYASLQKNLGPSGVAMVVIREDLMGHELPETPKLLSYKTAADNNSLTNTVSTFAIYVVKLVLEWLEEQGGVAAIEENNKKKAARLYDVVDRSSFYKGAAHPDHRSIMNVPFHLPSDELTAKFLKEALDHGLYALKGHRAIGGIRASIYNPMPMEGIESLASFMKEFEKGNG